MGNYRFKLSNMMPNAWFYKLKDMGKNRHHYLSGHTNNKNHPPSAPSSKHQPLLSLHNHSNCYHTSSDYHPPDRTHKFNPKTSDTHFPDPPRKSKKQANRRSSKLVSSSVSAGCSCRATFKTVWKPDCSPTSLERNTSVRAHASPTSNAISDPFDGIASWSSSSSSRVSSSASDIIIDVNSKDPFFQKFDGFDPISELELPPILTEPARIEKDAESVKFAESNVELQEKNADGPHSVEAVKERSSKTVKEERRTGPARRSSSPAFQGLKIHANSPRMASEKMGAHNRKVKSTKTKQRIQRKSATESFAVMKSSFDPQRDFRESMMEMIVENNIRAPKDLEDLLACYLSLNSSEYHDVIVKVFEQIWFDLTNIHL